jgi:hypothetical protein
MADATTNEVPSRATRLLIAMAHEEGQRAAQVVAVYLPYAEQAIAAFDAEVNPLDLDDDTYERVERESGLHALLQQATDMEAGLVTLFEDRR